MKYSEFLFHVMENLTEKNYFICRVIDNNNIGKQYPDHADKLRKTIANKLKSLKRSHDDYIPTTLLYLELKYQLPPIETRIKWLKTLAAFHAKKGN